MATIEVPKAEFWDLFDGGGQVEVRSRPWRHGRKVTYKVEKDGVPYLVELDEHHDDGAQVYGDTVTLTEAKKVTKTIETWEVA